MNTTILFKFESATTLAVVLLLMHTYYSLCFNIQLFKEFYVYEECELVPYLHQSIFKIPSKSFGLGDITGLIFFHLYFYLMTLFEQDVAVIRHNLCQLLDIAVGTLRFIGYKEGSTIPIFGVPEAFLLIAEFEKSIRKKFMHSIT